MATRLIDSSASFSQTTGWRLHLVADLVSQDTATNTSFIGWTVTVEEVTSTPNSWFGDLTGSGNLTGNLTTSFAAWNFDARPGGLQSKVLASGTTTATHAADGTATFTLGATANTGTTSHGSATIANYSVGLPTIPSKAGVSLSPTSGLEFGTWLTLTFDKASSLGTQVRFGLNGATSGWSTASTASSYQWLLPESWMARLPNSTSGTLVIDVRTLSGSTTINTSSYFVTCVIPSDVVPTVTGASLDFVNPSYVPASWGSSVGIQGISVPKLNRGTLTAGSGATIANWQGFLPGSSYGNIPASYTSWNPGVTVDQAGGIVGTVRAVDSRGRYGDMGVSATVYEYANPRVIAVSSVQRCTSDGTASNTGTYASFTVTNGSWSSIGGRNSATLTCRYRLLGATSWTDGGNWSYNAKKVLGGSFSVTNAYEISIRITDSLGRVGEWQGLLLAQAATEEWVAGGKYQSWGSLFPDALKAQKASAAYFAWPLYVNDEGLGTARRVDQAVWGRASGSVNLVVGSNVNGTLGSAEGRGVTVANNTMILTPGDWLIIFERTIANSTGGTVIYTLNGLQVRLTADNSTSTTTWMVSVGSGTANLQVVATSYSQTGTQSYRVTAIRQGVIP
jgi:hypothetical protein